MTSIPLEPTPQPWPPHRVISFTARFDDEVSPGDWACDGIFGRLPGPPRTVDLRCWPVAPLMRQVTPPDDAWPCSGNHWTRLERVLELAAALRRNSGVKPDRTVHVVCGAIPDEWVTPGSYFKHWAVCTPDRPAPNWEFLGYDVIDDSFSSAIRGAGEFSVSRPVSEMEAYVAARSKLNANLLMPDLASAVDLARFVDAHADGGSSLTAPCALLVVRSP